MESFDQIKNVIGFKSYTYEKLEKELMSFSEDFPRMCTRNIMDWVKECHPTMIYVHAFNSMYRKFESYISEYPRVCLVYIVKDHHLYPITDETLKRTAAQYNDDDGNDLLKHMADYKWSKRHFDVHRVDKQEDLENINEENKIIILPEEVRMSDMMEIYNSKNEYYVEYLHWNNSGILDGFIDHNKNVVHDFVMPSVLKKIDKRQYGTIPKSCTTHALVSMIHNWHVN